MITKFLCKLCVVALSYCLASSMVLAETKIIGNITFTLAEGLDIERVADESLIQWPIAATYHETGDLLILECHWIRGIDKKKQLESKPHKIVRLSDTDGDRKYDKRTVIADGLGFPEGIMVLGNDLLVTAPPQILRLADKDNDGFFESREVWFDGATVTGCANDLHGPMMGPDGWIYWTKGAFAEQNHQLLQREDKSDGEFAPSKAAHIYRRHPMGGPIERLMSGGMDNPSDLTFSPEGELFFCSTFLHNPGNGLRDGIAHSPRGGLFGKRHQVIDGLRSTGELLQPIANLGPAAPASVNYLVSNAIANTAWYPPVEGDAVGDAVGDVDTNRFLVSAQFNLQKVGLHRLVPNGSSFETENDDVLSADRVDFHPVDILEEPDGSLLVFDTGGWYDLCCPSSGSEQFVARGGIYRLSRGNDKKGSKILNPGVVKHQDFEADEQKRSMWAIARNITAGDDSDEKAGTIISRLADPDPSIQQTAAHIVGLNRWGVARGDLERVLQSESSPAVRAAMESLGVVGNAESIVPILTALNRFPDDRFMMHSAIYALMEIGATNEVIRVAKETGHVHERYATLYALNQLGKLTDELLPLLVECLTSSNARLRELSLKCLTSRPQGLSMCVPFLKTAWEDENASTLAAGSSILQLGIANESIRELVAEWIRLGPTLSLIRRDWLLDCIQDMGGVSIPNEWGNAIITWMNVAKEKESLVKLANAIKNAKFAEGDRETVAKAIRSRAEGLLDSPQVAIALLAACPAVSQPQTSGCATVIIEQLVAPDGINVAQAEVALSRSTITKESANQLLQSLAQIPPLQLQSAIDASLRCEDASIDLAMLEKLPNVPATKTLAVERLMASLGKRSDEHKNKWTLMLQMVMAPPDDIVQSLDAWLERLPKGDSVRGYQVFRSAKAACSSCHQVGYIGGRLGPELSRIGKTRTRRDLVEAIVFPSFRMSQGYYPVRIRTVDDAVFNGIFSKQTDSYVELLCGADKVCRIATEEIAEKSESKLSVMPTGLEQQMSLAEFADLIAFLESKK